MGVGLGDIRLRVPSVLVERLLREIGFGNDFADEGLEFGWRRRDLESLAKHGLGFVEERGVFAEESDQGLVGFEFVAELRMHLNAGVGGDGSAWFRAACSEALHSPPHFFAVHRGEIAGGFGGEGSGCGWVVVSGGGVAEGWVAFFGFPQFFTTFFWGAPF